MTPASPTCRPTSKRNFGLWSSSRAAAWIFLLLLFEFLLLAVFSSSFHASFLRSVATVKLSSEKRLIIAKEKSRGHSLVVWRVRNRVRRKTIKTVKTDNAADGQCCTARYQIKFRCMRRRRRSYFDALRRLSRLIPVRQRRKVVTVRSGQFCGFSENSSGACTVAEFKAPAWYSLSHARFQRLNRRRRRRFCALSIACSRKNWRRNLNSALTMSPFSGKHTVATTKWDHRRKASRAQICHAAL